MYLFRLVLILFTTRYFSQARVQNAAQFFAGMLRERFRQLFFVGALVDLEK